MGTGYTRTDTINNIADGNIINASDFDAEYDAIEAAFNSSSGHTHDGTSSEGGPVTVLGPAQDFVASTTEIKPKSNNTLDIGTTGLKFKDMHLAGTANLVNVTTTGDVTLTGAANNVVFDASDNALEFADNAKGVFGAGDDLQIYHDGTNSYIENNTNELFIQGDGITLRSDTGTETYIAADLNGAVELYHDNSKKLETTATGVTITGSLAMDGLHLDDNEKLTLGDSSSPDLEIFHNGSNSFISDTGTGSLVINGTQINIQNAANDAVLAEFIQAGAVNLYHNGSGKFATDADGVNVTGQIDVSTNANVSGNISVLSDGGVIKLGVNEEVTLTHEHNVGVQAKAASGFELNLQTGDTSVESGNVLGKITFNAPDEAGSGDAILDGAAIEAVAEATFASDNNSTALVFKTNTSAAATERMRIKSDGTIVMDTQVDIDNITIDGNTISSTDTDGNITLAPNGDGDVQLDADTVRVGDNNANATITTNGTGDLILNTNAGSSSGSITIADGSAGDITISPDGTGSVDIKKLKIASGSTAITSILDEDDFASDSATGLATQQSIKAYISANVSSVTSDSTTTFTNKSLTAPILTGSASSAGSIIFKEDTDNGTNAVTLVGAADTADVTVTLPAVTGTIITTGNLTDFDVNSIAALSDPIENGDEILIHDTSGGARKKATFTQIQANLTSAGFSKDDPTALAIALG